MKQEVRRLRVGFAAKISVGTLVLLILGLADFAQGVTSLTPFFTPFSVSAADKREPLVADKGKFRIMVNGQTVGKEEFEIGPSGADWTAHGNSEITTPQGVTKVTALLPFIATAHPHITTGPPRV